MSNKPLISKEVFCQALELIQQQDEINHKFSEALQELGDGFFLFGVQNKYLDAVLLVLREAMDDRYEYISWWLYEAKQSGEYIISAPNENKSWDLKEPEALYDYIVNECD